MKSVQTLAALLILAVPARASFTPQMTASPGSVPSGINYQGRLEQSGIPVNTSVSMVFKVYDALSGGNLLWTSPTQSVSVSVGLFNTVVPLPVDPLIGGGSRFMEVVVNGTALAPREPLNAVPYALVAKTVEGTVDISSNSFTLSSGNSSILYVSSATGRVGIGTTSPAERLHISSGSAFVQYGVWTSTVALIPQAAAPAGRQGLLYYDSAQDRLNVFTGSAAAFVNVATGTAVQQAGDTMTGTLNVNTAATVTSVNTSSNVVLAGGALSAPFGVFTGGGSADYSINASSGINAPNGPVVGQFFVGNLQGVASGSVAKIGDTMTGQLTIRGASVGVSTLSVAGAGAFGAVGASQATLVVQSTSSTNGHGIASFRDDSGNEVVRVRRDGLVGIGTGVPSSRLDVQGLDSGAGLVNLQVTNAANNPVLKVQQLNAGGNATDEQGVFVDVRGAGRALSVKNNAATLLEVQSGGNVGVSLSNPVVQFANTSVNTTGADGFGANASGLAWLTNGSGYAASFVNTDATAAGRDGVLIKTSASDNASYPLQVNVGASNVLTVRGDGRVGVATTAPGTALDVNGTVTATGLVVNGGTDAGAAWTAWAPTITGFSANPVGLITRYVQIGKTVIANIDGANTGTSNATTYTITLPVAASRLQFAGLCAYVSDNGTQLVTPAMVLTRVGSTTADIYRDITASAWTNSGAKSASRCNLTYEAQ